MAYAALDLNDASLVIARDGEVVMAGVGYATEVDGALAFGDQARARVRLNPRQSQRRYWAGISEAPLPQAIAGASSAADLVHRHLAALWAHCAGAEGAILAVTPAWSPEQLGLALGIARDLGIPVAGLVDGAVAATRRPYPGRTLRHLEATLDGAWLTHMGQDNAAALASRERIPRLGIERLERSCAEFVARRFVACSRFDPLHDAASEQRLYDQLPQWLALAARQERVTLAIEHGGNQFEATVEAVELRREVARACEPLTQRLRALMSPREPSVLQVHSRLADFPGVVEALGALPACTVVLLEPAAAARGALRLRPASGAAAGLRLTTSLPWDQDADTSPPAAHSPAALVPTHIVLGGRAWRLAAGTVQVGAELGEAEYGIRLDGRTGGVSRRHCAIALEDGRVVVHDQSRYGTFLNGHRIEGSAVLHAGDVLRVGQPPLEFALIAEVERGT
jgi:hypothetical protein